MTSEEIVLKIQGVNHWFGSNRILHDVTLKVVRGQILSLVGPSGCGKSTLLRAIVGTHPPCEGRVTVHSGPDDVEGKIVEAPGRDRGIVYQQYSLFPFLTAQQNVALGLMFDKTTLLFRLFCLPKWLEIRKKHMEMAAEFLERVGLGHAIKLYPTSMSGGMRQRVAIAQALIMKPEILLLDEPFGALDEATREELQRMLLTLYLENRMAKDKGEKAPYTILIVTHELNEAIYVGDRVVGLSQYWNWREQKIDKCPGATIVYDKIAPVYQPGDERNYGEFAKQREEIRDIVFDPQNLGERNKFRTFWEDVHAGKAGGIFE